VQYLLLVFIIFEVLEGPIHGGNELETSNCNERHTEPCKNIIQHRDMCWYNIWLGSMFCAATVLSSVVCRTSREVAQAAALLSGSMRAEDSLWRGAGN
jgi:hypothetical protein